MADRRKTTVAINTGRSRQHSFFILYYLRLLMKLSLCMTEPQAIKHVHCLKAIRVSRQSLPGEKKLPVFLGVSYQVTTVEERARLRASIPQHLGSIPWWLQACCSLFHSLLTASLRVAEDHQDRERFRLLQNLPPTCVQKKTRHRKIKTVCQALFLKRLLYEKKIFNRAQYISQLVHKYIYIYTYT